MKDKHDWSIDILDIADDFYEAYRRCREEKPVIDDCNGKMRGSIVSVPAIVNGAFALELYLKSLIPEKQRRISGHNFSVLYSVLDAEKQDFIKQRVEPRIKGWHFLTFDTVLEGISQSFEYWRYIHEKEDFGFGLNMTLNILSPFIDAIRELVLSDQKSELN